jgi:hypothetical protein
VAGDAPDCPGAYPNNWTCVNQNCVHLGCTGDADCVMDGFTCKMVRGTHQCVHLCTTDTDCLTTARMPGTKCLDEIDGGGKICIEDL